MTDAPLPQGVECVSIKAGFFKSDWCRLLLYGYVYFVSVLCLVIFGEGGGFVDSTKSVVSVWNFEVFNTFIISVSRNHRFAIFQINDGYLYLWDNLSIFVEDGYFEIYFVPSGQINNSVFGSFKLVCPEGIPS